ncbi:MFS transporter [Clostridium beijerinckii]|nr:MFS transporter [Clostridium beijerinckii]
MKRKISSSVIFVFAALSGLLFGYDTGVISGAILFIQEQMHLNSWQQGWVVSSVLLGAILGSAIIGPMSDKYGRRKLVVLSSIIFFVGALGSAFSPKFLTLIISRIVLGVAVGASSALIPTYLAELSPAEKRGSVSSLFQLMVMSGILLAYITNYSFSGIYIGWRFMLGFAAIPSVILLLGSLVLPESPRFLVKDGRVDEAREVLQQMNKQNISAVNDELVQISKQAKIKSGGIKELFGVFVRPALVIGFGLATFQQIMGCNTVLYYAPTIFTEVGFGVEAALIAHIGIGVFNIIITAIAVIIMDKIDRKKMLIYGAIGMGVSLIVMSFSMKFSNGSFTASIICVIALTIYIAFFSATWGPVMWVMIGEVFPLNIRGLGNSFSSVINWSANMIVSLTFPPLLNYFGTGSLFIGYGIICFMAIWFVKYKVFETRNRSLEEIESTLRAFTGKNRKQDFYIHSISPEEN